jgi:hypothetical protein
MGINFKAWFSTAGATLMLSFAGCSAGEESAPSPSNSFALSEHETLSLTKAAEGGDVSAMNRLALHYGIHRQDLPRQLYWLEQAGNAGDEDARKFVLGHYSNSKIEADRAYGESLQERWTQQ